MSPDKDDDSRYTTHPRLEEALLRGIPQGDLDAARAADQRHKVGPPPRYPDPIADRDSYGEFGRSGTDGR